MYNFRANICSTTWTLAAGVVVIYNLKVNAVKTQRARKAFSYAKKMQRIIQLLQYAGWWLVRHQPRRLGEPTAVKSLLMPKKMQRIIQLLQYAGRWLVRHQSRRWMLANTANSTSRPLITHHSSLITFLGLSSSPYNLTTLLS